MSAELTKTVFFFFFLRFCPLGLLVMGVFIVKINIIPIKDGPFRSSPWIGEELIHLSVLLNAILMTFF